VGADARLVTRGSRLRLDSLEEAGAQAAPAVAAFVAFALTRSTMLPGLGFWDTGEFQAVAPVLGTAHPTGYPAFVILGWLASLVLGTAGEPAARLNVMSGLLLAAAAAVTVIVVRQVGGRLLPGLAAGVVLALTPLPWTMGSFADPHMLHLLFVAALLGVLAGWEVRVREGAETADRWLLVAAALFGLSMANHRLTLLLAPGIAAFVLTTEPGILRRTGFVGRCLGVMAGVAALVYLELPIRAAMGAPLVYGHPDTLLGFLYVVLGVQFGGDVGFSGGLPGKVADLVSLTVAQFGPLALLIPAAFAACAARRPRIALMTGLWVLATCLFAATYDNAMIERYYLGPVLCVVVWLGAGASILVDAAIKLRSVLGWDPPEAGEPGAGGPGTGHAEHPGSPLGAAGRDWFPLRLSFVAAALLLAPAIWLAPHAFAAADQSADRTANAWSTWVFQEARSDAVICSWWSFSTPLWYRQTVLGVRPDITVLDDRDRLDENLGTVDDVIRANLGRRPVYLVRLPADLDDLATRWKLQAVEDPNGIQSLYLVTGPVAGPGDPSPGAAPAAGG
jgi:hypothetical protein